ncbi:MAG TPA: hypothetical protein DDY22_02960 [Geobacter sp.]|nr:hypothetical protein [Geobacter sp.]
MGGSSGSKNTPIPLLTSPLKGEGPEQRKISAHQVKLSSYLLLAPPPLMVGGGLHELFTLSPAPPIEGRGA